MNLTSEPMTEVAARAAAVAPRWMSLWTVLGLGLAIYAIRMLGPEDLADSYHQERAAAYVMDALRNGHWICQHGYYGEVSSKPPMLTWLAALASLPFEQANWFALTLPGALATMGLAALIFWAGSRYFGRAAGFFGALVYLLSPIGAKQMVLARIDGLFSLTVTITALLAFRAWQTGRGWTWFWLAGAVTTLTKGPFGVLLGGVGLLAAIWERRTGFPASVRGNHLLGLILHLVICAGWFGLAYAKFGQRLIDVMVGSELVGHAVGKSHGPAPFTQFYAPTVVFLSRYAPWSLLTCVALWRPFKRPSAIPETRRWERFVSCWFLAGLLMFSCSPHQRPDLIFPLIAPAALLAGRVVANWMQERARLMRWLVPAGTAAALMAIGFNYCYTAPARAPYSGTAAVKRLAAMVKQAGGTVFPLTHVESPYALQFYLNTKKVPVDSTSAARLLAQAPKVFIATSKYDSIQKALGTNGPRVYLLFRWPHTGTRVPTTYLTSRAYLELISNHPRLEWTDDMHWLAKPCLFRLTNVSDLDTYANEFTFESKAVEASVTVQSVARKPIRVQDLMSRSEKVLNPNESWVIKFAGKLRLRVRQK